MVVALEVALSANRTMLLRKSNLTLVLKHSRPREPRCAHELRSNRSCYGLDQKLPFGLHGLVGIHCDPPHADKIFSKILILMVSIAYGDRHLHAFS